MFTKFVWIGREEAVQRKFKCVEMSLLTVFLRWWDYKTNLTIFAPGGKEGTRCFSPFNWLVLFHQWYSHMMVLLINGEIWCSITSSFNCDLAVGIYVCDVAEAASTSRRAVSFFLSIWDIFCLLSYVYFTFKLGTKVAQILQIFLFCAA